MEEKIFSVARKIFGEHRFEEVQGQLWIDRDRLVERAARRVGDLPRILKEWEDRFRRDTEEGRWRRGANGPRRRVMRFGELPDLHEGRDAAVPPEDLIAYHIKEKF